MNQVLKGLTTALCLVVALFLAGTVPAQATIIPAGGSAPPSDFGALTGALIHEQMDIGVAAVPLATFVGDYVHAVLDLGGGELVFLYQLITDGEESVDDVLRITASSFGGYVTDVGYTTLVPAGTSVFTAGGVTSTTSSRSGGTGSVVRWDFAGGIAPGAWSAILGVKVRALEARRPGSFTAQDGSVGAVNTLSPFGNPVPEPGTYALMGAGLLALGVLGRRRKKG